MYPNIKKIENVYCDKCGSNEFWDNDFLDVEVYYCLHKFASYKYCGAVKAKCMICNTIDTLDKFGIAQDGSVKHLNCMFKHTGLTILKESNDTIIDNVRKGMKPANIQDLRDFLAQRHIFILGINSRDKI